MKNSDSVFDYGHRHVGVALANHKAKKVPSVLLSYTYSYNTIMIILALSDIACLVVLVSRDLALPERGIFVWHAEVSKDHVRSWPNLYKGPVSSRTVFPSHLYSTSFLPSSRAPRRNALFRGRIWRGSGRTPISALLLHLIPFALALVAPPRCNALFRGRIWRGGR